MQIWQLIMNLPTFLDFLLNDYSIRQTFLLYTVEILYALQKVQKIKTCKIFILLTIFIAAKDQPNSTSSIYIVCMPVPNMVQER